jgi:sugar phosphate isomerase/epimerase
MQVASPGRPHLTYCTNIHPGESLAEVRGAIESHVVRVRQLLGVTGPFGVGLRLSARAAAELSAPGELASFRELLEREGLYVFTINGFPFGAFHGERVKEAVYRPDWLEPERVRYSDVLARILAELLPAGCPGSISTVPGAFRARATTEADGEAIAEHLLAHAAALVRLREETGRVVEIALEPEPCCFLETTADTVRFFERHVLHAGAVSRFARVAGLSASSAEEALRRHVGVCLDACHLAVEFEDARTSLDSFRRAGIRIGKIQVTTALRADLLGVPARDEATLAALERFADDVYLHQVVVRSGGHLVRHLDLPGALAAARAAGLREAAEWRVHFHVPVFADRLGPFGSTRPFLEELLGVVRREHVSAHLEVETYTWDVLPEEHRALHVDDAIVRELEWTMARLSPTAAPDASAEGA